MWIRILGLAEELMTTFNNRLTFNSLTSNCLLSLPLSPFFILIYVKIGKFIKATNSLQELSGGDKGGLDASLSNCKIVSDLDIVHQDSDKYHEAGYDAYITGLCFIAMANRSVTSFFNLT